MSGAVTGPEERMSETITHQSHAKYPPMVAVDLGAGSCRVSLLTWADGGPDVSVIHRFPNAPIPDGDSIRWDFDGILAGVEAGLRLCAWRWPDRVAWIGVA